ncbi:MAG: NusG domain II-containing protein [Sphaerochaetaceae bacterium]
MHRAGDIITLAVVLVMFVLISIAVIPDSGDSQPMVSIRTPDAQYLYPLDQDRTVEVEGLEGISIIMIQGGKARFVESPCENKTCLQTEVSHSGQYAACLPNGIMLLVTGSIEGGEIDEVAF